MSDVGSVSDHFNRCKSLLKQGLKSQTLFEAMMEAYRRLKGIRTYDYLRSGNGRDELMIVFSTNKKGNFSKILVRWNHGKEEIEELVYD